MVISNRTDALKRFPNWKISIPSNWLHLLEILFPPSSVLSAWRGSSKSNPFCRIFCSTSHVLARHYFVPQIFISINFSLICVTLSWTLCKWFQHPSFDCRYLLLEKFFYQKHRKKIEYIFALKLKETLCLLKFTCVTQPSECHPEAFVIS